MWQSGNWIRILIVSLYISNIIISQPCPDAKFYLLPRDWPCAWNNGVIPFVFDLFAVGPNRLMTLVNKGHEFLEERSCLRFKEHDPRVLARKENYTYLYYTYANVLEGCCQPFYNRDIGRRMVVITPVCSLPAEVAHATLHGMGLLHEKRSGFNEYIAKAALYPPGCRSEKIDLTMLKTKVQGNITT